LKVKEMMTSGARAYTLTDSLSGAASIMCEVTWGMVPVITNDGRVVGLVTNRDTCKAANFKNLNLANISDEDISF
jgi:predicted transcriptional regulator